MYSSSARRHRQNAKQEDLSLEQLQQQLEETFGVFGSRTSFEFFRTEETKTFR